MFVFVFVCNNLKKRLNFLQSNPFLICLFNSRCITGDTAGTPTIVVQLRLHRSAGCRFQGSFQGFDRAGTSVSLFNHSFILFCFAVLYRFLRIYTITVYLRHGSYAHIICTRRSYTATQTLRPSAITPLFRIEWHSPTRQHRSQKT